MRQRWNNLPLRTQLALAVLGILVPLLIVFGSTLYGVAQRYLRQQTRDRLFAQLQLASGDGIGFGPPAGTRPRTAQTPAQAILPAQLTQAERDQLERLLSTLTTSSTSVVIYGVDGSTLGAGPTRATLRANGVGTKGTLQPSQVPALPAPARHQEQLRLVIARQIATSYVDSTTAESQMVVVSPLLENGRFIAIVQLAAPLGAADALLARLVQWVLIGTLLSSAVALVLSWWAARALVQPLQRVVGVSRRVAQGDLDARTYLTGQNEAGELGQAFDHMVDQLQASFAVQRRFVADAAHELRTPLTSIGGMVELLLLGAVADPAQQHRTLQRVEGETERMSRLVQNLLLLSRLDAEPTLNCVPLDLHALADDVVQQMQTIAPQHQIKFMPGPVVPVQGDADKLRQVLINLLDNARTYTPPGGTITVTVEGQNGMGVVRVADTGVGIPPADVPHVWDRFYRVDQARARHSGGAGLGLALVKSIVEAHGGQVALDSTPNQGTTVTIALPLAPQAAGAPTRNQAASSDHAVVEH